MNNLMVLDTPVITEPAQAVFKYTATGLEITGKPTFEQWLQVGDELWYMKQSVCWMIGDWLNFGEHEYGQKYSLVIDETRYSLHSLQNIAYTCNAIPVHARRENVPFSSHSEVASLSESDREYALDMLQSKQWSRQDLRDWKRTLRTGIEPMDSEQLITLRATDIVYKADKIVVVFEKPSGEIVEFKAIVRKKAS